MSEEKILSPEQVRAACAKLANEGEVTSRGRQGTLIGALDKALTVIEGDKDALRQRRLDVLSYVMGRNMLSSNELTPGEWYALSRWNSGRDGDGERPTWAREVSWCYAAAIDCMGQAEGQLKMSIPPVSADELIEQAAAPDLPDWFTGPDDQDDLDKATELAPQFFAMMQGLRQNAESLETVFHMAFTMGARWERWKVQP